MTKFRYYADSIAGVKQMLTEKSDYISEWIDNSEYRPDRWVRGCWLVTLPNGQQTIAYVADHKMAPDFEEIN